ncbi:type IV pilus biogenesis/stability protein PilW [Calditrichota bacterium]
MKRLIFTFVLILSVMAQAGPDKIKQIDKQIMNHLFNAELNQADSLINLQISKTPDQPKYYVLKANYHFYSRYFTQGLDRDSILQLIVDNSQKAIELGEKLDQTTEIKFYLGSAYGYLTRALVMQREYWDGYWTARDSRNYLNDVLDEDPSYTDAYLGLGVIEYFTGLRYTGFYNFLVWFVGMSGERDKGLEYFTIVAEKGELFKNEANLILGTLYGGNENDQVRALEFVTKSMNNFPQNNFFVNQYNRAVLLNRINEEGVGFLEAEFDSLQSKYSIANSFVLNVVGYNFINQNRLDDALVAFKTNLKLYPDVANCYDSLAECYMTRGENELAIKYYKMAYEKLDTDTTIGDQFRDALRQSIPERLEELGAQLDVQT